MAIVSLRRIACYAPPLAFMLALVRRLRSRARCESGCRPAEDVQAKLAYCEVCHGVSAQGFHGYYPIPRLAGQQIAYMENQLQGFVEHRRTNNIMFNVGHVLSPAMITALATEFHDLDPKPLGGGPKDMVSAGQKIFNRDFPMPRCRLRVLSWSGRQRQRPVSSSWRASFIPIS